MREQSSRKLITRDQLVTIEDLEQFKSELTDLMRNLLKGTGQHTKPWLKSHEVRKLLDISAGKLLTLRINGTLPYTRIGGVIYYSAGDIQNLFEKPKRP